jgi:hypothetical protein
VNSAKTCVITMLILSMVTPGFLFDCLGKSNDPTRPTTHHSFSPFIVDRPVGSKPSAQQKSEPLSFSLNQPYMAGYMTTRYLSEGLGRASARALSVTVSFRGTNKAVIQADNALGAGIAAQGPDRVVGSPGVRPWIDWGYTMLLTLDGDVEYPYILMEVFKAYEWGATGLWPIEPPFYDRVSTCTWALPGVLTINSEVILKMVWNSTCLNYIAFFGGFEYKLYSYTPEPTAWPYFMLGTCYRYHKIFGYLGGTVKWFQFPGAWSEYSIGRTGWHSYIQNPCIIFTEEQGWRYVDFAYSVDGPNSFMDNTLGWGGETYWGVNATYSLHYIHFYPTSNGVTLPLDTLLWHTRDPQDAGCPFVYSWIRNQYVEDNNILPQSERGERIDIKDYYRLEQLSILQVFVANPGIRE